MEVVLEKIIVGTWLNDKGQTCSYFEDGTFSASVPFMQSAIKGRWAFYDGVYVLESGGSVLSTFQILSHDQDSMRVSLNNGEIHTCQRVENRQDTSNDRNKSSEDWLKPGNRVVLHSLKGSASLNGSSGVVKRFDKFSSRYVVFVDKRNAEMKIRKVNLKPSSSSAAPTPHAQTTVPAKSPYVPKIFKATSSASSNQQQFHAQSAAQMATNHHHHHQQQQQQTNAHILQQMKQQNDQLQQQMAQMKLHNAQMQQQLHQQTMMNHQQQQVNTNGSPTSVIGHVGNITGLPQAPVLVGGVPQQQQQPVQGVVVGSVVGTNANNIVGGGNNNKPFAPAKKILWNAIKQGASQIDPADAGEFLGAAAGEFVQGVGGLFGLGGNE